MPHHKRADLLAAAEAFCGAFAQQKPLDEIMSHFCASTHASSSPERSSTTTTTTSTSSSSADPRRRQHENLQEPLAHEHGLPQLAPFLGRDYRGRTGVKAYFEKLAAHLQYEDMRFAEFVVDAAAAKVACRGSARFTWKENGLAWDETFAYVLKFKEEGEEGAKAWKVARYEVWADSGAAYLARMGQLEGKTS
ncbi:hypothetical protein F4780DRAFT_775669 [Xylariomycetidae sp. FL0641]|nr:hypothetical protein F4780DRAFT_775669 [Xylariomycetidae sp. FL0641]